MIEPEFLGELNRLEIDKGREYSAERRKQLFKRLKGFSGWAWRCAVDHLLDTHETSVLPGQAQMLAALNAANRQAHGERVKPDAEGQPTTAIQRASNKCFAVALGLAMAAGNDAVKELGVVADAVAVSTPESCICHRGLLLFQRVRDDDGNALHRAYGGPCGNGCGRAPELARKIGQKVSLPVVDLGTMRVSGWVGSPRKRLQVLDDDPCADTEWR